MRNETRRSGAKAAEIPGYHNLNFRCKTLLRNVREKGRVYADFYGEGDRQRLEELRKRGFLETEIGSWSGTVIYKPV